MTTSYWSLAGADFAQDWSNTEQITTANDWSGVASIMGYRGDDLTTGVGIDPQTITTSTAAGETVNVFANQSTPNTNTSGGIAEFDGIANPVVALQGSGTADAPYLQLFLDATGRRNVTLSFNARDIDASGDNAVQPIAVQYRVGNSGSWTNLPSAFIADASTGPGQATQVTPVNVTLPDPVNGQGQVQVRIITTNAFGSDEWIGIDDIKVTSTPGATLPQPGVLTVADAGVLEGNDGTAALSFTVTRANGSEGAVSATWTATLPGGATGADASDLAAGQPLTGTVAFAAGQTSATVTLQVRGDAAFEADETLSFALSAPTGGATIGTRATATGTILNDDAAPPAAPANVFFNEIHYDNTGIDAGEAIEVAGVSGTSLAGWSIALYRSAGTVYDTIPLSGVLADQGLGYGTLSFARAGIQNGTSGFALVNAAGSVVQFLSYEGSVTATAGPAAGQTSTDIGVAEEPVPGLGFSLQLKGTGSSAGDFTWTAATADSFGQVNAGQSFLPADGTGLLRVADARVAEGDSGATDLVFTVRRAGGQAGEASVAYTVNLDGSATAADLAPGAQLSGTVTFAAGEFVKEIRIPVQGDTVGEGNETLSVTLGATTGNVRIDRGTATGTIVNDDPLALTIAEIQGAGHRSEYAGQEVITTGIVTAVKLDNDASPTSNAFYIQMATGDGNDATSDAIQVFLGRTVPTVQVGDAVSIRATVTEFASAANQLTLSELTNPTITVTSQGNALPAAVLIGEGGRVLPTAVIDDDGLTSYDPRTDALDFWESLEGMRVTVDTPQAVSTTIANPIGSETYVVASNGAGATGLNARGGITISPGDYNPERIQLLADAQVFNGYTPSHTVGDRLGNVSGIVNYGGGDYSVVVTAPVSVTRDVTLDREVTALKGDATHLSLATYNVENLDPGDTKFAILASDIVNNLKAPDILAVQEIQDADGAGTAAGTSGQPTADKLIAAIKAISGITYTYVEVAPAPNTTGGEPGGNIRAGYLYNDDRLDYVAGSAKLIDGQVYQGTRRPLVAQWAFNGETLTTVNVHLTSRGGSDPLYGSVQPPTDAGDAARTQQAAGVKAYVAGLLAADPSLNVAILGDWNGFYFEEAQQQLTRDGTFTNLNTLLPVEERYSYLFEGNAQQIDNILVTGGLLTGAEVDAVHLNSQLGGERPTDHDPQVALFALGNQAPVSANDAVAVNEDATSANLYATLLANDRDDGALTITGVDTAGTLGTVRFDAATRTLQYVADADAFDALATGATATDRFAYTVTDAGGLTSTATVEVTVTGVDDGVNRVGTARIDTLVGTDGEDTLSGLGGPDTLSGGNGHDLLLGGEGTDWLYGDAGNDTIRGGIGNDRIYGGDGNDVLYGEAGNDGIWTGAGRDEVHVGRGTGLDSVYDFDTAFDRIVLDEGVAVASYKVSDLNRDGVKDIQITFTSGSGVKLYGIGDIAQVAFVNGTADLSATTANGAPRGALDLDNASVSPLVHDLFTF